MPCGQAVRDGGIVGPTADAGVQRHQQLVAARSVRWNGEGSAELRRRGADFVAGGASPCLVVGAPFSAAAAVDLAGAFRFG
jgi:hypothetical protein